MQDAPIAVVETREFLSRAQKLMGNGERTALVDYLARSPDAGDLIKGAGGVRKLRWALTGRGKSGGARVIYFFHNEDIPLYVLSIYAKNQRANISDADRNDFKQMAKLIVESYRETKT